MPSLAPLQFISVNDGLVAKVDNLHLTDRPGRRRARRPGPDSDETARSASLPRRCGVD